MSLWALILTDGALRREEMKPVPVVAQSREVPAGVSGVWRTAVARLPGRVLLDLRQATPSLASGAGACKVPSNALVHNSEVKQQRHAVGSIVSGSMVSRGAWGSVPAIPDRASGWLPGSELARLEGSRSSLAGHVVSYRKLPCVLTRTGPPVTLHRDAVLLRESRRQSPARPRK
jgi:hypothetical protein